MYSLNFRFYLNCFLYDNKYIKYFFFFQRNIFYVYKKLKNHLIYPRLLKDKIQIEVKCQETFNDGIGLISMVGGATNDNPTLPVTDEQKLYLSIVISPVFTLIYYFKINFPSSF